MNKIVSGINLCPLISENFSKTSEYSIFFSKKDSDLIRQKWESREHLNSNDPNMSCHTNLFFGFFFDGTKNNYVNAESSKTHSNVVRLYDCFPGMSVPGVLPKEMDWQYKPANYNHFFKVYIPDVASAFKEVGDTGQGLDLTLGAAMGYKGEVRIIWAWIQAINNVHRYLTNTLLIKYEASLNQTQRKLQSLKNSRP